MDAVATPPAETSADAGPEAAAAGPAPLGFAQVAFAGHNRAEDMGDPEVAAAGLRAAWALLAQAGVTEARLLTGVAGGADQLAVQTWRAAGLGPIQAILPFLEEAENAPLPDDLAASALRLDGAATRTIQRSPHLAQTRWLIGAADLLVTVWKGQPPRGSGGTADAVRLALEHGVPVLWINPDEHCALRLIRPEFLFEDCGFMELVQLVGAKSAPLVSEATPEGLHRALADLGLTDATPLAGVDASETRPPSRPLPFPWRAYAGFRRLFGGSTSPYRTAPPPPDLAAQPGFALLSRVRAVVADEARRLGAIHRSQQVLLLGIAILMAIAGSAPALWPKLKLPLVSVELTLALIALLVWARSERRERHQKWGEARKRAEDLRLERVAWTVGVSTMPHGAGAANTPEARQARRLAGLPSGSTDPARVRTWGAWALDELLTGQASYHRDQAFINGRISHRVHQIENLSFLGLLLLLGGFLAVSIGMELSGGHAPSWLSGIVYMTGSIVPAIGAAGLALEATLSLGEQASRSRLLSAQLEALKAQTPDPWTLDDLQSVARTAIRLQRAQEEHWTAEIGRRRLFRGG